MSAEFTNFPSRNTPRFNFFASLSTQDNNLPRNWIRNLQHPLMLPCIRSGKLWSEKIEISSVRELISVKLRFFLSMAKRRKIVAESTTSALFSCGAVFSILFWNIVTAWGVRWGNRRGLHFLPAATFFPLRETFIYNRKRICEGILMLADKISLLQLCRFIELKRHFAVSAREKQVFN